jgi:hypothetical protein
MSKAVNQAAVYDTWVQIGSASLSSTETYYIQVATNTGESNKKVGVDDFLIIRRP